MAARGSEKGAAVAKRKNYGHAIAWAPGSNNLPPLALAFLIGFLPIPALPASPPAAPTTIPGADQPIFFDPDGLIVHRSPGGPDDGGDTSQREGWYWFGVWLRQNTQGLEPWPVPRALNFQQVLDLMEPGKDGVFYRHPKLPPWNDPHGKAYGYSRDQLEPMVAAMGVWGRTAEIQRLWDALPEDLLGKHAFNGNWRNFLGQDGNDCSAIKRRGCDATDDCSLKVDDRDCSLRVDTRDCSLQVDTRDCSLRVDTRSCGHDITVCVPFTDICHTEHVNDPVCELAKGTQNAAYKAEHDACEVAKATQNASYKAAHDQCELEKFTQNAGYKAEHDACEAGKAAQNLLYISEKTACEAAKAGKKAACEGQKAADQLFCMMTNVHSGDIIGPMTVNLFRRAMGEDPLIPLSTTLRLPPVNVGTGALGEAELALNVGLRLEVAGRDRDDTGDDLNLIVKLLMAHIRHPSPMSESALNIYAQQRDHSFGSFLGAYHAQYGEDATDIETRIADGIRSGWAPECSAPLGAVRWYHRKDTGANPALATLYEPILSFFMN